ncbi:RsmB/NOP family class I SAM-dependent RNA methyltransferase [Sphingomonas sp. BGYR3]|uniref:RsmB/NOP family class I SAM-dependent RNA methyltransferase n=1 Tax=Sphingomonas sp. BGYR3 TaxID=2975483 RepID=UPI0021A3A809|nr:RsmB/NOP family class I SAM-dependent RNA methyltransferase [Sphingomonas sp. BGYR3]MDG5487155.1 RsmB/NOP family class I SAM-dependent RNA methyltransferase [Sphingomonas sp. BGYR3]
MTPGARVQAAIELLDAIILAARDQGASADVLIARYFAGRRYAGSKDRRAVRELVYAAIRMLGDRPVSGRTAMLALADSDPALAATFGSGGHAPAAREAHEVPATPGVLPEWLAQRMTDSGVGADVQASLLDRAPLDIRVNPLRSDVGAVLAAFPEAAGIDGLPNGLRLPADTRVDPNPLYEAGAFEIQDAGSQWVTLASGVAPGMAVIDLCAGGGGKTLALAAMMAGEGRIIASDTDRARLSRLAPRAARAGVTGIEPVLINPMREAEGLAEWHGRADHVLIDAPCSGTGTWRRNPEARWRLTPDRLVRLAETQQRLLGVAARLVRPGGTLTYIVCSLLDAEGRDQAEAFLAAHPDWTAVDRPIPIGTPHGPGLRLDPATHSTDGFFVVTMAAKAN